MKIAIGPSKLTKYERARIVGARSLQLSMGAPILVDLPEKVRDLIDTAILELAEGVLPITIRRSLPDGSYEDIPLRWLTGETGVDKRETADRPAAEAYMAAFA